MLTAHAGLRPPLGRFGRARSLGGGAMHRGRRRAGGPLLRALAASATSCRPAAGGGFDTAAPKRDPGPVTLPHEHGAQPDLTEPQVSCRLVLPFLLYMDREHGEALTDQVLAHAGLPRATLLNHDGWVSGVWLHRFAHAWGLAAFGLTEPPPIDHEAWQLWRAVGRESITREALGAFFSIIRAAGAPGIVYRRLPELAGQGNRVTRVRIVDHREGRIQIRLEPIDPERFKPGADMMWNVMGLLEATPRVWDLPLARVALTPDLDAGTCDYDVRFEERSLSQPLGVVGAAVAAGAVGAAIAGFFGGLTGVVTGGLAGGVGALAWAGWRRAAQFQQAIREDAAEIAQALALHDERIARLHEEGSALRRSLLTSQKLSGYLPGDLVDRIVEDPELALELGGTRTVASVLFADIVGFTPRCEAMTPELVIDELNHYFAHIDPCIESHGGIIDKRMGDGVMVVFVPRGAEPAGSVAGRAIATALAMLRALPACNAELAQRGAAPFEIRVGVASGPLVQGNMGSPVKLEFTVVGDTVNLAARLEGEATPGHVLVTADALPSGDAPALGSADVVDRRTIRVKGKAQPVRVVELRPR